MRKSDERYDTAQSSNSADDNIERLARDMSDVVLKSPTETHRFKLSADAAVFVPRGYSAPSTTTHTMNDGHGDRNQSNALSNNGMNDIFGAVAEEPGAAFGGDSFDVLPLLLKDIDMYLRFLQSSPASFDDVAAMVVDLMNTYIANEAILESVVELIFNCGVDLQNFAYQCARLCAYLANNYVVQLPVRAGAVKTENQFRHLLLKQCHGQHDYREQMELSRLYNFSVFLAELFNQMKNGTTRFTFLRDGVYDIVDTLLASPTDGNVACAVQVIKCCGPSLQADERRDFHNTSPRMDAVFASLNDLAKTTPLKAKPLIVNLNASRVDWGRMPTTPMMNSSYPGFGGESSDTVFFGPDGTPLSAEETAFLEQECGVAMPFNGDEETYVNSLASEDDEIAEAYDEFLKMTEQK